MRHTSGRRNSFDDSRATVLRRGELLGSSVRPTSVQMLAPHQR